MTDLAEKYRPKTIDELAGEAQRQIAQALKDTVDRGEIVNPMFFVGESGWGKTSIAKMYASWLGNVEVYEYNCSDLGKDKLEDIFARKELKPLLSDYVLHIFDETAELTSPQQAKLLKHLEELPSHFICIFATLTPEKLRVDFRSRLDEKVLPRISVRELKILMMRVFKGEGWLINEDTVDDIVEKTISVETANEILNISNGNARTLMKNLGRFMRGEALGIFSEEADKSTDMFKAIFYNQFNHYLALKDLKGENLTGEVVRLCRAAITMASKGGNPQAEKVLLTFGDWPNLPEDIQFAHRLAKLGLTN